MSFVKPEDGIRKDKKQNQKIKKLKAAQLGLDAPPPMRVGSLTVHQYVVFCHPL
jgi:hypothetical protein